MHQAGTSKLLLVFILLIVGLTLWAGFGLGSDYVEYRSTQDFDTFIAEVPVASEEVDNWLPTGEPLMTDQVWSTGEQGHGQKVRAEVQLSIGRGKDSLLATTVHITGVVNQETGAIEDLAVQVPETTTRHDVHAVVQVGIFHFQDLMNEDLGKCEVFVEAVMAAGSGADEFRVVALDKKPKRKRKKKVKGPRLHALLGLLHPTSKLPETGILYHARTSFIPKWEVSGDQMQGPEAKRMEMITNCREYTYDIAVSLKTSVGDGPWSGETETWPLQSTWNGELW
jgi:hypothetical protein